MSLLRAIVTLVALLVSAPSALAQFAVISGDCAKSGAVIAATGPFGVSPYGSFTLGSGGNAQQVSLVRWTMSKVRLRLPSGAPDGSSVAVNWLLVPGALPGSPDFITLGMVDICGGARVVNPKRAGRDVVAAPGGSPEYVVSVAPGQAQAATRALQAAGAELLRTRPLPNLGRTLLIFAFPGDLTLTKARGLLQNAAPSARLDEHTIYGFAEGPRLYAASLIGDDPGRSCRLGRQVAIGLIDGPVNPRHLALAGTSVLTTSVLVEGETPAGADHGTAVAGLIAGESAAFQGFAPGARLVAVTAFGREKGGVGARLENIAAGLDFLASQGVRLVNLSMDGSPNDAFADILARARRAGLVMVAAAGNEGTSNPRYPAASPDVLAVTAVDAAGKLYAQANTGPHIDFAAPGVDLYVAKASGGGYRSGTSYAAPIVTALIARLGATSLEGARTALGRTARDLGTSGPDTEFGLGLVQTGGC